MHITVIGAGAVGTSSALYLQRSGHAVTLIDPQPCGGASYGNGGLLFAHASIPVAIPGMFKNVPAWLTDPLGPLAIRKRHLPAALPWLLKWAASSRMRRVKEISDAMFALYKDTIVCWHELLGDASFASLVRTDYGAISLWETGKHAGFDTHIALYQRHHVDVEVLDGKALLDYFPGMDTAAVDLGILIPGDGYIVNPQRAVLTLLDNFLKEGGTLLRERVLRIVPESAGRYRIVTNASNQSAERLLVAAGIWSRELLAPLGLKVPLESERGYHIMLRDCNLQLKAPLIVESGGFEMTPMEEGMRVAGTVEIAGVHAPMNEKRAWVLTDYARRLFPGIQYQPRSIWMGHRPSTPDNKPMVGPVPGHSGLYVAFGHGHFGMMGGPPTGRLLARIVNGQGNAASDAPYDPGRFLR